MAATPLFVNTFDAGTDEGNLTAANSADSGNAFASIVINGASVGSGGITALSYEADAAIHGSIGVHFDVTGTTANGNYLQAAIPSGTGDYIYTELCFTYTGNPTSLIRFGAEIRAGSNDEALIQWGTDGRFVAVNDAGAQVTASKAPTMTSGHDYGLQLAMKPGTGTTDGYIGLRLWDYTADSEAWAWSASNVNAGTVAPDAIRFRLPLASTGITALDLDTVRIGRSTLADDWLAPYSDIVPPSIVGSVTDGLALIDVTASTIADGGTFDISQDSGPNTTPTPDGAGRWLVAKHTDTPLVYTVTGTNPDDSTDTATFTVEPLAAGGNATLRYYDGTTVHTV